MEKGIYFKKLDSRGDNRGQMFNIAFEDISFLGDVKNIHFGSITPGNIRGNHYHYSHKEIIIINAKDEWEFAFSYKDSNDIQKEIFVEEGAILIKINENIPHSIKNTGQKDLEIVAITNQEFSKDNNDTAFIKLL